MSNFSGFGVTSRTLCVWRNHTFCYSIPVDIFHLGRIVGFFLEGYNFSLNNSYGIKKLNELYHSVI